MKHLKHINEYKEISDHEVRVITNAPDNFIEREIIDILKLIPSRYDKVLILNSIWEVIELDNIKTGHIIWICDQELGNTISIKKYEDEYYSVVAYTPLRTNKNYLCDQLDDLLNLLEDIL